LTKPEAWLQVTTTPKLELDRAEQRLTEYNKKNRDRSAELTGDIDGKEGTLTKRKYCSSIGMQGMHQALHYSLVAAADHFSTAFTARSSPVCHHPPAKRLINRQSLVIIK